jgi:GNAT superfamily N-acetyltransferase
MASGVPIEILDLRHFAAPVLRPVLEAEGEVWKQRLHWDYRVSARLLMQYLDSHMLPGYAALESGQVTGYVFCVYEESKAVIGDVFALPSPPANGVPAQSEVTAHEVEETLLRHLLELLVNSPQVDRVESQLLLHPSGGLDLRLWRDEDLNPAARLISAAYNGHPDSVVNDQYRTAHGSQRFLNNIVRYSGCGVFSAQVSHVVIDRTSREMVALVLGSRVSPESGHITQICVHPEFRRRGLARMLLNLAASCFLRQGVSEISLTVTEANAEAVNLYRSEGYECSHSFDAAVWQRKRTA